MNDNRHTPPNAIAIIGMAGRFPGAATLGAFWSNLRDGVESIVDLSADDLLAAGVGERALTNRNYVRRAALLDGIDEFDADFFGFTPHTARTMDPQHRLFLQCAWHAFEDAGCDPARPDTAIGVFGTSSASGYLLHNLMSHQDPGAIIGEGATFDMINLSLQNDKDHLATRVAHQFDLRGPALSVQTACSSSLVAVHLACQAILSGECDLALAGGSSIRVPHRVGYWHEPGSMVSPTGHCRPFDVRSDGTIFGSGVGAVLLKPLADALADGDRIHAVIRGSAINNDGATKMNYAAPNAVGQAEVIAEAHAVADVDAATVSYIETHGTGTPLGDPIELDGLRQAFAVSGADRAGPCHLGSVKANIGHLEVASGIAGLIKTVLCLKHRELPATLHYTAPNPELHLDDGPFRVSAEHGPWEWDGARRAGVSSFGVGGTNAHLVLEEAPPDTDPQHPSTRPQVLLCSASSPPALDEGRAALADALAGRSAPDLADVAATLAGRRAGRLRMAAVATGAEQAVTVLRAEDHDNAIVAAAPDAEPATDRVVFLFPGQGTQHPAMARGLYDGEPVFAENVDRCAAAFGDELGIDLLAELFDADAPDLERTDRAQPALFTVQYALAQLVASYGVRPAALAGHSIGEYAAATIAGVFDLPTAVKAVAMRARLMHAAPRGVMIAVPLGPAAITEYLSDDVDLATVNDPGGCVVAGSAESIAAFSARLSDAGIAARRVRTSHAFHSQLMDSVVPQFQAYLDRLEMHEPQLPLLSNVTGTWLSAREATDPATWARQIRATVRFADEVGTLLDHSGRVLVEVGPGGTLTGAAMRHPDWSEAHRSVRLMRHPAQNRSDQESFLLGLGQLWAAGVDVDWSPRHTGRRPRRVWLPGYPFDRQRHWVDHNPNSRWGGTNGSTPAPAATPASNGQHATGASAMEATVQRIWAQCLGVDTIDRTANFFDLGGDSLTAISVAMAAGHEGLDLTPQDLYDTPTVMALAKRLTARYEAGGLARPASDDGTPVPVPPTVSGFLETGLAQPGRWRIPLLLRLHHGVEIDAVHEALTAVINHHDALRVQLVRRDGIWEQEIGDTEEFTDLSTRELADGTDERQAVRDIIAEEIAGQDLASPPLTACYIRGGHGRVCHLVLTLHAAIADTTARDIVLTDVLTALGQRAAGQDITLAPVPVTWAEWSRRCAALASHPAVIASREYWLEVANSADLRIAGSASRPRVEDLAHIPTELTGAQTIELDDARRRIRLPLDDLLLAALGRATAGALGTGVLAVDTAGPGRSVLKPDVDVHRTVGFFDAVHPIALPCHTEGTATQHIEGVRRARKSVPHYGIGFGLLKHCYAPTARLLTDVPGADLFFRNVGTIPELPDGAPDPATDATAVQFDPDTALPVRDMNPGLGHAVELRVYRTGGVLHLDWWHDVRRVGGETAQRLAETYAEALLDLARAVIAEDETNNADDDLTLVDLSSAE
ncbi:beta-ketoacyl synthase N-terminal-like domain-containing protein [Mycolicibacillus trivialis]